MSVVCWLAKPILRPATVTLTGLPKMSSPTCVVVTGLVPSVVLLLWALIGHGRRRGRRPGHHNTFITILWMLAGGGRGEDRGEVERRGGEGRRGRERGKGGTSKVNKTVKLIHSWVAALATTLSNVNPLFPPNFAHVIYLNNNYDAPNFLVILLLCSSYPCKLHRKI